MEDQTQAAFTDIGNLRYKGFIFLPAALIREAAGSSPGRALSAGVMRAIALETSFYTADVRET
jgi:hypothetical protein